MTGHLRPFHHHPGYLPSPGQQLFTWQALICQPKFHSGAPVDALASVGVVGRSLNAYSPLKDQRHSITRRRTAKEMWIKEVSVFCTKRNVAKRREFAMGTRTVDYTDRRYIDVEYHVFDQTP